MKFYHGRTIKRRKFNRIFTLRINGRDWCSDQDILQFKAVEFFERQYGKTSPILRGTPCFGFPNLTLSNISFLEAEVIDEEIKRALFDMVPLKAPGSDGYHALFFQIQWDTLGRDVCQWVKEAFKEVLSGRKIDQELNNTLIVLIP